MECGDDKQKWNIISKVLYMGDIEGQSSQKQYSYYSEFFIWPYEVKDPDTCTSKKKN